MNDKGYFPPSKLFLLCGMCYLILRNLGETSRHFSIISTLAGKESSQFSRKRRCLTDDSEQVREISFCNLVLYSSMEEFLNPYKCKMFIYIGYIVELL